MKALLQLIECGQSYWMDNLSRNMIENGELEKRVKEQGLRGITSNPTIFNKAISGGDRYDRQIDSLVAKGTPVPGIFEALAVKDIQDACDILRPVFDESEGKDGFVSLEVSPYLAHDTEGTQNEVRRLFQAVNRPNVFIKIPGTKAGVPAIEQMLYEGMNINITLLFSVARYEAVAEAYLRALERRVKEDKSIRDIASVASFFLSRIDVLVDQVLGHRIRPSDVKGELPNPERLLGQAAVANAKLAYQSFKKLFRGERWQRLADKGARVQRPLWASTGTKNPLYSDVKYVEPLIGPDTVNTMPEKTIEAFADHGRIVDGTIEHDSEDAERILADLRTLGIDLDFVAQQLENEGVQKFMEPYDDLMKTLSKRRETVLAEKGVHQQISFGDLKTKVSAVAEELDQMQFGRRLFAKDPFLWGSDSQQVELIRNRLGWLDCVSEFSTKAEEIAEFANTIKDSYRHVLLIGMGGSSLSVEVARQAFPVEDGWPQLLVLDKTDPAAIRATESLLDPTSTLVIVASKSGTTTETLNIYKYFYAKLQKHFEKKTGQHFVAITDSGSPLVDEAQGKGFRRIFENRSDIGGRYSALSYFGLVPMALGGIDISSFLAHARAMELSCDPAIPTEWNPGLSLGVLLGTAAQSGRDKVTFVLSDSLQPFGDWAEQLLAESTGKDGRGLVPVVNEPLGSPEAYADDRLFVNLHTVDAENRNMVERLKALEKAGHPVVSIALNDVIQLGAEFLKWEIAVATAGTILGINPFDEPNVTESKENTRQLLDQWRQEKGFPQGRRLLQENGAVVYCDDSRSWPFEFKDGSLSEFLTKFIRLTAEHDYIALLPYFMETQNRNEILQEMRELLRDKLRVATTVGYGPRYLHSTGQLHKGGPNSGIYLVMTAEPQEEKEIPEQDFDFETLQQAQVLGDFQALNSKERRVIRIHLGEKIDDGLEMLKESLAASL